MKDKLYEIGIDEAGRGPLAGPVAVGAVLFKMKDKDKLARIFEKIKGKDSKKLTPRKREEYFEIIKEEAKKGNLQFAVSFSSAKLIDQKGIVFAIKKALACSLEKVSNSSLDYSQMVVLLDGSLHAPEKYLNQKTIIRGDESELSISLASIIAKVTRDKKMVCLAKKYPLYGFERHKGYGTRYHYQQILKYGLSHEHRVSFLRKILNPQKRFKKLDLF